MAKKNKISPPGADPNAFQRNQQHAQPQQHQAIQRSSKAAARRARPQDARANGEHIQFTVNLNTPDPAYDFYENMLHYPPEPQRSGNGHDRKLIESFFEEGEWISGDETPSSHALVVEHNFVDRSTAPQRRVKLPVASRIGINPDLREELEYKRHYRSNPGDLRSRLEGNRLRFGGGGGGGGEHPPHHLPPVAPMTITTPSYPPLYGTNRPSVHERISAPPGHRSTRLNRRPGHQPLPELPPSRPVSNRVNLQPQNNPVHLSGNNQPLAFGTTSTKLHPASPEFVLAAVKPHQPVVEAQLPTNLPERRSEVEVVVPPPAPARSLSNHSSGYSTARRQNSNNNNVRTESRIERPEPVRRSPPRRPSPPPPRKQPSRERKRSLSPVFRRRDLSVDRKMKDIRDYERLRRHEDERRKYADMERRRREKERVEEDALLLRRRIRVEEEQRRSSRYRRKSRSRSPLRKSSSRRRRSRSSSPRRRISRSFSSPRRRSLTPKYSPSSNDKNRKRRRSSSPPGVNSRQSTPEGVLRSLSRSYSLEDVRGENSKRENGYYSPIRSRSRSSLYNQRNDSALNSSLKRTESIGSSSEDRMDDVSHDESISREESPERNYSGIAEEESRIVQRETVIMRRPRDEYHTVMPVTVREDNNSALLEMKNGTGSESPLNLVKRDESSAAAAAKKMRLQVPEKIEATIAKSPTFDTSQNMSFKNRRNLVPIQQATGQDEKPLLESEPRAFKITVTKQRQTSRVDSEVDGCLESGNNATPKWTLIVVGNDVKTYRQLDAVDFPEECREEDPRWALICARRVRKSAELPHSRVGSEEAQAEPKKRREIKTED